MSHTTIGKLSFSLYVGKSIEYLLVSPIAKTSLSHTMVIQRKSKYIVGREECPYVASTVS